MTKPEVGDFIEVPAWKAIGMVLDVRPAIIGSDDAIEVLLQEHHDQPIGKCRVFRLEPGEFTFAD